MPIYEYVCKDCGYEFERMQPFSAEPLKKCPLCAGSVRRVISPVGVIFKGSGWYITDSKRQLSATASKGRGEISGGGTDKSAPAAAAASATPAESGAGSGKDTAKPAKDAGSRGGTSTSGKDR
jgi:putative FmdB family regulatory protein